MESPVICPIESNEWLRTHLGSPDPEGHGMRAVALSLPGQLSPLALHMVHHISRGEPEHSHPVPAASSVGAEMTAPAMQRRKDA